MSALSSFFQGFPAEDATDDGLRFGVLYVDRLKIMQDVIDGRLTTSLASQRLGLTDRHCRRLLARYRESRPLALANRRRGLRGKRQLVPGLTELALAIIRDNYADFGPTLATEKLLERHGIPMKYTPNVARFRF
jgi:hypothetical protein